MITRFDITMLETIYRCPIIFLNFISNIKEKKKKNYILRIYAYIFFSLMMININCKFSYMQWKLKDVSYWKRGHETEILTDLIYSSNICHRTGIYIYIFFQDKRENLWLFLSLCTLYTRCAPGSIVLSWFVKSCA